MAEDLGYCQYYYKDLELSTLPDVRLALPLRKYWWTLKRIVWLVCNLGLHGSMSRGLSSTRVVKFLLGDRVKPVAIKSIGSLNLKPGDWVEVRSAKEIFTTLDMRFKLKGLTFTPEMTKFCGKRFRVHKRIDKIILEATGELRRIKSPTALLDGVFCDGSAHGGCDRSCFCFWREEWLKKV